MSDATIRPLIVAVLATVPDIGRLYAHERAAADWSVFLTFFKVAIAGVPQIRGWEVSRKSCGEALEELGAGQGNTDQRHGYVIRGYLGVSDKDNTEKIFNDLIDAIADAFRNTRLADDLSHDYIRATIIESRFFSSVLCHYTELSLTVTEEP